MLTTKQDETPIAYQLIAQTQDWKGKAKYWRKEYFKLYTIIRGILGTISGKSIRKRIHI